MNTKESFKEKFVYDLFPVSICMFFFKYSYIAGGV